MKDQTTPVPGDKRSTKFRLPLLTQKGRFAENVDKLNEGSSEQVQTAFVDPCPKKLLRHKLLSGRKGRYSVATSVRAWKVRPNIPSGPKGRHLLYYQPQSRTFGAQSFVQSLSTPSRTWLLNAGPLGLRNTTFDKLKFVGPSVTSVGRFMLPASVFASAKAA
jgi:hypothetical protein